jgi:hypothetical protein
VGGALVNMNFYMNIIYSRDKKLNRRLVELDVKKLIIRYLCFIPL